MPEYGLGFFLTLALILIGFATNCISAANCSIWSNRFFSPAGDLELVQRHQQVTATLMGRNRIFSNAWCWWNIRKGLYLISPARPDLLQPSRAEFCYVYRETPTPPRACFVVPEEETIPLNLSVEDAIKMIVSGGMLTPAGIPENPLDVWP